MAVDRYIRDMRHLSLYESFNPDSAKEWAVTFKGCIPNRNWNIPETWTRCYNKIVVSLPDIPDTFDLFDVDPADQIHSLIREGKFDLRLDPKMLDQMPEIEGLFNKERMKLIAMETFDIRRFMFRVQDKFYDIVLNYYIDTCSVSAIDCRSKYENDINDEAVNDIMLSDLKYPKVGPI